MDDLHQADTTSDDLELMSVALKRAVDTINSPEKTSYKRHKGATIQDEDDNKRDNHRSFVETSSDVAETEAAVASIASGETSMNVEEESLPEMAQGSTSEIGRGSTEEITVVVGEPEEFLSTEKKPESEDVFPLITTEHDLPSADKEDKPLLSATPPSAEILQITSDSASGNSGTEAALKIEVPVLVNEANQIPSMDNTTDRQLAAAVVVTEEVLPFEEEKEKPVQSTALITPEAAPEAAFGNSRTETGLQDEAAGALIVTAEFLPPKKQKDNPFLSSGLPSADTYQITSNDVSAAVCTSGVVLNSDTPFKVSMERITVQPRSPAGTHLPVSITVDQPSKDQLPSNEDEPILVQASVVPNPSQITDENSAANRQPQDTSVLPKIPEDRSAVPNEGHTSSSSANILSETLEGMTLSVGHGPSTNTNPESCRKDSVAEKRRKLALRLDPTKSSLTFSEKADIEVNSVTRIDLSKNNGLAGNLGNFVSRFFPALTEHPKTKKKEKVLFDCFSWCKHTSDIMSCGVTSMSSDIDDVERLQDAQKDDHRRQQETGESLVTKKISSDDEGNHPFNDAASEASSTRKESTESDIDGEKSDSSQPVRQRLSPHVTKYADDDAEWFNGRQPSSAITLFNYNPDDFAYESASSGDTTLTFHEQGTSPSNKTEAQKPVTADPAVIEEDDSSDDDSESADTDHESESSDTDSVGCKEALTHEKIKLVKSDDKNGPLLCTECHDEIDLSKILHEKRRSSMYRFLCFGCEFKFISTSRNSTTFHIFGRSTTHRDILHIPNDSDIPYPGTVKFLQVLRENLIWSIRTIQNVKVQEVKTAFKHDAFYVNSTKTKNWSKILLGDTFENSWYILRRSLEKSWLIVAQHNPSNSNEVMPFARFRYWFDTSFADKRGYSYSWQLKDFFGVTNGPLPTTDDVIFPINRYHRPNRAPFVDIVFLLPGSSFTREVNLEHSVWVTVIKGEVTLHVLRYDVVTENYLSAYTEDYVKMKEGSAFFDTRCKYDLFLASEESSVIAIGLFNPEVQFESGSSSPRKMLTDDLSSDSHDSEALFDYSMAVPFLLENVCCRSTNCVNGCTDSSCPNRQRNYFCLPDCTHKNCRNCLYERPADAYAVLCIDRKQQFLGILAAAVIPEGALIGIYEGDIMTMSAMEKLNQSIIQRGRFLQADEGNVLISTATKSPLKYIKHACEESSNVSTELFVKPKSQSVKYVVLVAKKAIASQDELTITFDSRIVATKRLYCECHACLSRRNPSMMKT